MTAVLIVTTVGVTGAGLGLLALRAVARILTEEHR